MRDEPVPDQRPSELGRTVKLRDAAADALRRVGPPDSYLPLAPSGEARSPSLEPREVISDLS